MKEAQAGMWYYDRNGNGKNMEAMTLVELDDCINHCDKMLTSDAPGKQGRLVVLNQVYDQVLKLHAETKVREFMKIMQCSRAGLLELSKETPEILTTMSSKGMEFIPEDILLLALKMNLGEFIGLTHTFILRQGVCISKEIFTKAQEEEVELKSYVCELLDVDDKLASKLNLNKQAKPLDEVITMLKVHNKLIGSMTEEEIDLALNHYLPRYIQELYKHVDFWNLKKEELIKFKEAHADFCN